MTTIQYTILSSVWCNLNSLLTGRAKIINLVFVDSVYINPGPLVLFISFHVINSSLQINYHQQNSQNIRAAGINCFLSPQREERE